MGLLFLFMACGLEAADSGGVPLCRHDPPLTYENFGKGYLDMHCNGCHSSLAEGEHRVGAPASVNLDTYNWVLDWVERIDARATGDIPTMPPGGGPTPDEVANLEEWLYCTVYADRDIYVEQQGQ